MADVEYVRHVKTKAVVAVNELSRKKELIKMRKSWMKSRYKHTKKRSNRISQDRLKMPSLVLMLQLKSQTFRFKTKTPVENLKRVI